MKFYNAKAPNPKVVRMFMAEKGIEIPFVEVDLTGGENRRAPYNTEVNSGGQVPALELDDGTHVCEVTAICEYLEELHPSPSLIGETAVERAETRMWNRRIDLEMMMYIALGFRGAEGADFFKDRMRIYPDSAADFKKGAQEGLAWLNALMEGKTYICHDRFSLADVSLYVWLEFGGKVGQGIDDSHTNILAWFKRVQERPSAKA